VSVPARAPGVVPDRAPRNWLASASHRVSARRFALPALVVVALVVAACGGGAPTPAPGTPAGATDGPASPGLPSPTTGDSASPSPEHEGRVVVYSGRSEELVSPILAQFEESTGIRVEVRYGDTAELAATILEEGANSPADLFFGQDAGALGALGAEGRLAALPQDLLGLVDPRFRSPAGEWVGVTGRARVLAYDTRDLNASDLPASILDLTDPRWRGRIGWVPTNASFQAFVTGLRQLRGDEAARAWLEGMLANQPRVYEKNGQALEAVRAGEVDAALINHYYLFQAQQSSGEAYPVEDHFFTGGDPGALVNVAGVAILDTAARPEAARRLVEFLLSTEAQTYFSSQTFEYPLVTGVEADPRLPTLAEIESPDIDLSDLADLQGTLRMLQEVGVL
jgi:iron(III) transport system substrate-binding protein